MKPSDTTDVRTSPQTPTEASRQLLCVLFGSMASTIEQWALLALALDVPAADITAAIAIGDALQAWCRDRGKRP